MIGACVVRPRDKFCPSIGGIPVRTGNGSYRRLPHSIHPTPTDTSDNCNKSPEYETETLPRDNGNDNDDDTILPPPSPPSSNKPELNLDDFMLWWQKSLGIESLVTIAYFDYDTFENSVDSSSDSSSSGRVVKKVRGFAAARYINVGVSTVISPRAT